MPVSVKNGYKPENASLSYGPGGEREVHKRDETGQSNTFIDNTFLSLSYLVLTFGLKKKKKPFVTRLVKPTL